jgi:hypothetical protein
MGKKLLYTNKCSMVKCRRRMFGNDFEVGSSIEEKECHRTLWEVEE